MLAMTDDPTSTKVWAQGAVGEERIGELLEQARPKGIEVLHDRRIPRTRANIDHLVVGPSGVWVVDAKRYLKGRVEPRVVGRRRQVDLRLYVGSRDKTALVVGVRKQVDLAAEALEAAPFAPVPVHGALCFVNPDVGFFARPFRIDGVLVTWRKHLLRPVLDEAGAEGVAALDAAQRAAVARFLADRFPPA